MTLRIIGGELGGRRLASPPARGTRPTRAAVREAWFSALGPELPDASVIDLFAGSGALGIEALSRGAMSAEFVESDARACRALRRNLEALSLGERTRALRIDVFRRLRDVDARAFDLALADPPYETGNARRLVDVWLERPFAGILCVEHAPHELDAFEPSWRRTYGDTELSFFIASEETS
ncbi:MAG: 16S rRNA (guanine(966)-N(2))-methyltransferase RsmD [Gemmatimonadota bacterium]